MDILFLDASVLFSAAYRPDARFLVLWKRKIRLVTSAYAAEEAERNLAEEVQRQRLRRLLREVEISARAHTGPLPSDVDLPDKDVPMLSAAMGAKCTHLITSDKKHFGRYFGRTIAGVRILPPAEYLHDLDYGGS